MQKVLILGGTRFIGRVLVEKLLEMNNFSITLFNRQKSNPALFPELQKIKGDRETEDIKQILQKDWDYVIDISCYYPVSLEKLISSLEGKVGRYIFISTGSVYKFENHANQLINESAKVRKCTNEEKIDTSDSSYGQRKAECERVLLNADWLDKIILRPSVVYGKYDSSDRLYYWLYRIKTCSKIILPDKGEEKSNYTFVQDFIELIIKALTISKHSIIYNACTHNPLTLKGLLNSIENAFNIHSEYINAPAEFLEKNNITPWADIPLWLNGKDLVMDNSKVIKDFNINFTDFNESISKTINYYNTTQWNEGKAGMRIEKEKELIEKLEK